MGERSRRRIVWDQSGFNEFHDRLDPVVRHLARAVHPLLVMHDKRPPRHVGCGVLLAIGDARFFLTAAHVLDEFLANPIHMAVAGKIRNIEGKGQRTMPEEGKRRHTDRIDAGVFRFKQPIPELEDSFLTLRDVNVRDWQAPKPSYLLFGYPASKTRSDRAKWSLTASPFRYTGPTVTADRYALADVHSLTHVALDFNIRRSGSKFGIGHAPSPIGVSGGGIWWTPVLEDLRSLGDPKLVAIFTDFQRTRRLLIGSRINYHFELIRSTWPELGHLLPRHGLLDLRVQTVEGRSVEP